jgi:hypothetical protein
MILIMTVLHSSCWYTLLHIKDPDVRHLGSTARSVGSPESVETKPENSSSLKTPMAQLCREIKMAGLLVRKQMFVLFQSQYVPSQVGHHEVLYEKCANNDGIHITLECWY